MDWNSEISRLSLHDARLLVNEGDEVTTEHENEEEEEEIEEFREVRFKGDEELKSGFGV